MAPIIRRYQYHTILTTHHLCVALVQVLMTRITYIATETHSHWMLYNRKLPIGGFTIGPLFFRTLLVKRRS